jgi:hypothetical protein
MRVLLGSIDTSDLYLRVFGVWGVHWKNVLSVVEIIRYHGNIQRQESLFKLKLGHQGKREIIESTWMHSSAENTLS